MIKIAPSILAANLLNIKNEVKKVDEAGADYIHIDIMDGHYVPNITFGPNIVKILRPITPKILDVHLMIKPVMQHIISFIEAGADIISFHPEADDNPYEIIEIIKNSGCKTGIAVHPNLKIKQIEQYIDKVDIVVVMTVVPGFSGQKFLENQLSKISELNEIKKNKNLKFEIEVDGGINQETSKKCIENGANILVVGSYIFGKTKSNYKNLIYLLK